MYNEEQLKLAVSLAVAMALKVLNRQQLDSIIAKLPQKVIDIVVNKVKLGYEVKNYYENYDSMVSILTTGKHYCPVKVD